MDKLWAPWRTKYIAATKKKKGCIFCQAVSNKYKKSQVVFKTKHTIVILNLFPYNNGHLLVSPVRHVGDLDRLRESEIIDLFFAIKKAKKLLREVLRPQGYNIGINIGHSAGAGITGHAHIHIVPRWTGDTNFMPVIHETKIISQSLEELLKKLKDAQSKTD